MCSSRPKSQPPPTPPPPPETVDPTVRAAGERERRRVKGQQGQQSTILTGAQGVPTPVTGQAKTLLGS
jgi:hypothetical protein